MTQAALSLVTNNTPTTPAQADLSGPTPAEKAIVAEYVNYLKEHGWRKIDNAASTHTRLFNRFDQQIQNFSYLKNRFQDWLRETGKVCAFRSPEYIAYTLPHVVGSKFVPKNIMFYRDSLTGSKYANTYRAYKPATESKDVSQLFLEYLKRLVPNDYERHIFMQWLAHMFQHPEQRPSWHLLITSEQGTGKGFLLQDILHPLLHHTSLVADYSRVTGRFSSVLQDNLLVMLDDIKARSNATQTQLKSILSEERAYIEQKHLSGGMVDTYTRFILASNEAKPLNLDVTERRWFVPAHVTHRHSLSETQAFIQSLADWLALPGSLDKVYNFFKTYSLEGFNHKCVPHSDGLAIIAGMSKNPCADFLEGFVTEHQVFTYTELVEAIKSEGLSKPSDGHLVHLLREVGYEKSQPRINKKLVRLCHPIGMTLEEKREAYAKAYPEPGF